MKKLKNGEGIKVSLTKYIRKSIRLSKKILKEALKDEALKCVFDEQTLGILLTSFPDIIEMEVMELNTTADKKMILKALRKYRNKNFIETMLKNKVVFNKECLDYLGTIRNKDIDVFLQENIYLISRYKSSFNEIENLFILNYDNILSFQVLKELHIYEERGHVYIEKTKLYSLIRKYRNCEIYDFDKILTKLINEKIIINDNDKIYFKESYEAEYMLADNLKQRLKLNTELDNSICKRIDVFIKSNNINKEGKNAIYNLFEKSISIITGQAGTGKSTLINKIIKCINYVFHNKKNIKVVSYTGKAVSRLNTGELYITANTIHRFLNIKENDKFKIKPINEKVDYLIVDEASMLDLSLMSVLLNSVPVNTKIILVGDIYQLQPIKAGSPFLDIFNSNLFAKTELTQIYRYSNKGTILNNALAIRKKDLKGIIEDEDFKILKYNSYNIFSDTMNEINKLLEEQYSLKDIMILSFNNNLVNDINNYISKELNKNNLVNDYRFNITDKVIQIKNNYEKDVYNGDTGIITSIINMNGQQIIKVKFDNKSNEVTYVNSETDELNRAYALTIHKSQGSEYKIVIIIIGSKTEIDNSLLYVAVTRAREKVIIISDKNDFYNAINKSNHTRNGYLLERIQN